jgi:DNA-binding HxlR family transcriptional regulator
MRGGLWRYGEIQILEALKPGPAKVSELRKTTPLYGAAFDITLSRLLMAGLVRRYEKDGEEYLELTDLGKSYQQFYPAPHAFWEPWHHLGHPYWHHHGWL